MEEQALLQEEEAERLARKRKRRKILGIFGMILLILAFLGWWMTGEMIGYTAHSKYETLCARARDVYKATNAWEADGHTLTVYNGRMDGGEEWNRKYYTAAMGYYAIMQDADGDVRYVLYSFRPIDERYLSTPPDPQEQQKLLKSHFRFRRDRAVGVYFPDEPLTLD